MTINEIEKQNKAAGNKFFDSSQVRRWKSRISYTVHEGPGGFFFVTSEPGFDYVRRYSVRQFIPETGAVHTPAWQKFATNRPAQIAAARFAREGVPAAQEAA